MLTLVKGEGPKCVFQYPPTLTPNDTHRQWVPFNQVKDWFLQSWRLLPINRCSLFVKHLLSPKKKRSLLTMTHIS